MLWLLQELPKASSNVCCPSGPCRNTLCVLSATPGLDLKLTENSRSLSTGLIGLGSQSSQQNDSFTRSSLHDRWVLNVSW